MAGQVFTIREAAMYLFGDDSQSAYYKARRAINELDYVKRGRSVYIAKSKQICVLMKGQFLTRTASADQLDDIAFRFHEAARQTRRAEAEDMARWEDLRSHNGF